MRKGLHHAGHAGQDMLLLEAAFHRAGYYFWQTGLKLVWHLKVPCLSTLFTQRFGKFGHKEKVKKARS